MHPRSISERWAGLASTLGSFFFLWTMGSKFITEDMGGELTSLTNKVISFIDPYDHITIFEQDDGLIRDMMYNHAEAYLADCCSNQAHNLKLEQFGKDSENLFVTIDTDEDIIDEFHGIKIWWVLLKVSLTSKFDIIPRKIENRYFRLSFHKSHREVVLSSYLHHVFEQGQAIRTKNKSHMLFTNEPSGRSSSEPVTWKDTPFHHPSTFDTLAMEPTKKQDIMADLVAFQKGNNYYSRIGKVWKRGYLLYGPPGTGKSSLIAAMANFLKYDVYDLELTAVKSNAELRMLFIRTTGKSIIVIEDIDCSLDFTRKHKNRKEKSERKMDVEGKLKSLSEPEEEEPGQVTLSGILNVIDGLWSSCSEERIIIFTTNNVDQLDKALTRRGRMDMWIEMSYCDFHAFKVLAKNYLGIIHNHLFEEIHKLLRETNITSADVAESLMAKSTDLDAEVHLQKLIKTLNEIKEMGGHHDTGQKAGDNWVRLV